MGGRLQAERVPAFADVDSFGIIETTSSPTKASTSRGDAIRSSSCSVTKIAGRKIRSQSVDTTMASLRAAKAAGVTAIAVELGLMAILLMVTLLRLARQRALPEEAVEIDDTLIVAPE